jgi:hypothetical protein
MRWVALLLLATVCDGTVVAPIVPRIPDPTVHSVPSLCPSDERLTRCRLLLNTKGHHVASLGAFLKLSGDGRFNHRESMAFHRDGAVKDSCLTFVHGDTKPVAEEISKVRYLSRDTAVEASWFFAARHDDAVDAMVMQIAFFGGRNVKASGSVWIYTTSLLGYESKITCDSVSDENQLPPGGNFAPDPPVLTAVEVARIRQAQDSEIEQRKQAHARAFQEKSWARRSAEESAAKQRREAEDQKSHKLLEESRARRAAEEAEAQKPPDAEAAKKVAEAKAAAAAEAAAKKKASAPKAPPKKSEAEEEKEDDEFEEREESAATHKERGGGLWQELAAVLWVLIWVAGVIVGLAVAVAGYKHFTQAPKKRF